LSDKENKRSAIEREDALRAFLQNAGWGAAERTQIPGDASTRRYERVSLGDEIAILMDAPKNAETPSEPEGASVAERKALGYNALARLAGPNPEAFVCISTELSRREFSAPKILATDLDAGFILLEDFGEGVYAKLIQKDAAVERPLYEAAIDTLAALYRSSFPEIMEYKDYRWRIREYDKAALLAETDLCLDWYAKDLGHNIEGRVREEWYGLWEDAFETFKYHAAGLCLRDFHAENLFWLPDRKATSRVGLIDFQDALFAHPAYDLVSFIEDARRYVSLDLTEPLISRFCEKAGLEYDDKFRAAYSVMGAQRNTKVIGFPVRADLMFGKPQYRALIPAVRNRLHRDLSHPVMKLIKTWYRHHIPEILEP